MAGVQAIVLLIIIPAIAWSVALFLLRRAREELEREGPPEAADERSPGRIVVYVGFSGAPLVFGIILYVLARPVLDAIDGPAAITFVRLEPVLFWAAFAFAAAACSAIAAQTWIVSSRLRAFMGPGFGRVFSLSAVPTTAVIFAVISTFLLLGYADSVPATGPAASDSALASAIGSFQAFAVGTIAFPVAAGFANRFRDLSQRGFVRAIRILEVGELPVVVGLVLIFLSLRAL